MEFWKAVKGYDGKYLVSTEGRIYSTKRKRHLNPYISNRGYLHVDLCINGKKESKKLHRLVADAFVPNPEDKPDVNHLDGNKTNCQVHNLEWCTKSENLRHAYQIGLRTPNWKAVSVFDIDGEYLCSFRSMKEAEERTGISHISISRCCCGFTKTAGGFVWKHANIS